MTAWRTRTDANGVVRRERPKPGTASTIERERISPVDWNEGGIIRGTYDTPRLIEHGGRSRSSVASNGQKLRFYPILEPTREVTIGYGAAQKIRNEIGSSPRRATGYEVGGWLLADSSWPDHIMVATEPGTDATFTRTSGMLGKEVLRALKETAPHLIVVGSWHLHPDGGSIPSETDRSSWAGNCDLNKVGFDVGIIATPGESWLSDPKLTGWLTLREGKALACERLRLRETG
jgi:proteasome lid subunit RPN8/RPN11